MLKFLFACIGAPDPTGDSALLEFLYFMILIIERHSTPQTYNTIFKHYKLYFYSFILTSSQYNKIVEIIALSLKICFDGS